jgi:hypothetical protein
MLTDKYFLFVYHYFQFSSHLFGRKAQPFTIFSWISNLDKTVKMDSNVQAKANVATPSSQSSASTQQQPLANNPISRKLNKILESRIENDKVKNFRKFFCLIQDQRFWFHEKNVGKELVKNYMESFSEFIFNSSNVK